MNVEFGNDHPRSDAVGPTVTYVVVPDTYTYEVADSAAELAASAMRHIVSSGGVTHLPGQEALLAVHASWNAEGAGSPTWVWSDNKDFEKLLGEFFACATGRPDNLEETHTTLAGPPGVGPVVAEEGSE